MLRHYLIVAFRFIRRNKLLSFINVFGLSVAFAFCVMIWFFVKHETSFDKFHKNIDQLKVVAVNNFVPGEEYSMIYAPLPMAPVLEEEVPEINHAVRYSEDRIVVKYGNRIFTENASFTDPAFFSVFTFPLLEGNKTSVLGQLNNVVITPAIAKKYFGEDDPIGKQLTITVLDSAENFIVSGVAAGAPDNSSINYQVLLRIEKRPFYKHSITNWRAFNTQIFTVLKSDANKEALERHLTAFTNKYLEKSITAARERKKLKADAKVMSISTYPFSKLHFNTDFGWPNSSNPKYSYILSGIALLILIIACINYISLALTSASSRTLEVGVRKSIGANKAQLIRQYWSESLLLGMIALIFGLVVLKILMPVFNELTGKHFALSLADFLKAGMFLLLITILISFITGGYPALFLSSFKPSLVLKNRNTYKFRPGLIKGLVVVQFALSAFLLISAVVMFRQMKFISAKDLGYDKEQLVVIPTYTGFNNEGTTVMDRLRTQLQNEPDIIDVSGVSSPPGNSDWSLQGFDVQGKEKQAYVYRIDYDFLKTMGIQLVKGRNISREFLSDTSTAIIVNEALVKNMEWKNPIDQQLAWLGEEHKPSVVIGVVKDFNFLSLENKIQPMIMYALDYDKIRNVLVKIKPGNIQSTLGKLEVVWKQVNPGKPFDYYFLGDSVAGQYANYKRWVQIMAMSTIMAVIIACLGLFGLSGILATNKTKEIGIRKVFGADVKSLLIMLNKDILILSVISFLISLPVAWLIMKKWLENFAYRVAVSWDIPAIAMIAVFLVALITVSYHSLRAATADPVKSLRAE